MKTPPSKLGAVCEIRLDLKGETKVASAVDKGHRLASEWSVFRMVIPVDNDAAANFDNLCMDKIYEETKAESIIYPYSPVGIVMVWAEKEDDALLGLAAVLNHFKDIMLDPYSNPPWFTTRLVISGAQASKLIRENIIGRIPGCWLVDIYLSGFLLQLLSVVYISINATKYLSSTYICICQDVCYIKVFRYLLIVFNCVNHVFLTAMINYLDTIPNLLLMMSAILKSSDVCFCVQLCVYLVFLTVTIIHLDTIPKLSDDDVILEIQGRSEFLDGAIAFVAAYLGGESLFDLRMMKSLKDRMANLPPINIKSAPDEESQKLIPPFRWPKHRRLFEISHFAYILPEYACAIIGEHGENIECIRASSSATIIIGSTANPRKMKIVINGIYVSELEQAEEVIQGFLYKIEGPKIFEYVFADTSSACTLFR